MIEIPTIHVPREDENLSSLLGKVIPAPYLPGVEYRLEQTLGKGGGAIAFLARRISPEGNAAIVIKVLRPAFVRKLGATASLLIQKEAVALGRLNERVPPTPFVVRFIDTGVLPILRAGTPIELPWVAIEYVHGGSLGTTLAQRIRRSLRDQSFAFDPARAHNAIESIGLGLSAVHEVGVIHRDLTPNNVLCSGRGADEIFKIADFGVARPSGLDGTLSGTLVGTPGFAAPELTTGDPIGTYTDVFSLASVIFFILTGEPLFNSMAEVMRSLETGRRRSLLEMPGLHPELRRNEKACRSIDLVLGWSAAVKSENRLAEALAVTSMVLPHLQGKRRELTYTSSAPKDKAAIVNEPNQWRWSVLHQPGSRLVIRSVAWDGHGRAIAATTEGLSFWNGTSWKIATTDGLRLAGGVRFVQRVGAGRWILCGDEAQLAIFTTGGAVELVDGPREAVRVEVFGGDLEDISVLCTLNNEQVVTINSYATKRWLKPIALPEVASISTISRFDDVRWILGGRKKSGGAYGAIYHSLNLEVEELTAAGSAVPTNVNAFLASTTRPRKSMGYLVGTQGAVLTQDSDTSSFERVPGDSLLSAVAADPFGKPWVASPGRIMARDDVQGWTVAWEDTSLTVPVVSLFLDAGLCVAMTADGAVIEGRTTSKTASDLPPPPRNPGGTDRP